MTESTISDNKSVRIDDDTPSLSGIEDSMIVQKQTIKPKNNEESDVSFGEEREINLNNIKSSINIENNNKEVKNQEKQNSIIQSKEANKIISHGNKISSLILEKKKNIKLHLKIDKEKSIKNKHTIYEISTIVENKKLKTLEKNILCTRRYDNFNSFYELLKKRYPHFVFPRLSPKYNNLLEDEFILEKRRKELEYFINEIYNHNIIGKGEEIKKFLNNTKFDKDYFENLGNFFDYPETIKKINDNGSGLINMGVTRFTNMINYFGGKNNVNKNERENSKKILGQTEKVQKKIEKYNLTFVEVKNIYECLKNENKEIKSLSNNLSYLNNEINSNDNNINKKHFNEIIIINQEFNNDIYEDISNMFEEQIVNPLDFCILDLEGQKRAIERYDTFLQNYNKIINYNIKPEDNKIIHEEKTKIKNDIEIFEENLIKELERVEENITKIFNDIIHKICIILNNSTKILIDKYKNSYMAK